MLRSLVISGKIVLLSGLHIGGSNAGIQIGGIDNPVIKNPINNMPYIPGSSLKGKIRFLLESYYGLETEVYVENDKGEGKFIKPGTPSKLDTKPLGTPDWDGDINQIAVLFGTLPNDSSDETMYPTRLIFRDSSIIGAFMGFEEEITTDISKIIDRMSTRFVEGKFEVAISRVTGTAQPGALRQIERVPAGTVFDIQVILRQFMKEDHKPKEENGFNHITVLKKGLKLLENDALGGYGSRGSGRIKFLDLKLGDEDLDLNSVSL